MERVLKRGRQDHHRGARRGHPLSAAAPDRAQHARQPKRSERSPPNDRLHSPAPGADRGDRRDPAVRLARQRHDRARNQPGRRDPLRQAGADRQSLRNWRARSARSAPASTPSIPFAEKIVWIDKRVRDLDMDRQQVLSTDQRRLEVDAFARYRVVDPLRMFIAARSEDRVEEALKPILGSQLRNELGKRPFASLLSPEREGAMENIRTRPQPRRPPIWRRGGRRADQEGRPARRHAARHRPSRGCAARASRRRTRSAPRAPRARRSSAPRPTPKRRRSMPPASARIRHSTISTGRCSPTRRTFIGDGSQQIVADQHHHVAEQRISEGIRWTVKHLFCSNRVHALDLPSSHQRQQASERYMVSKE